jgi:hypothetical protein
MRRAAVATTLLALALPGAALADTRSVRDELEPRAGHLDIASIGHGHDRAGRLVHRVTMQAPWHPHGLRPHRGELAILFDVNPRSADGEGGFEGHPSFERALRVSVRGRELRAELRGGPNHERVLARVAVWRPDNRTVKVAFSPALLGRGAAEYAWFVSTRVYRGERVAGGDAAPFRTSVPPSTLLHGLHASLAGRPR